MSKDKNSGMLEWMLFLLVIVFIGLFVVEFMIKAFTP